MGILSGIIKTKVVDQQKGVVIKIVLELIVNIFQEIIYNLNRKYSFKDDEVILL